VTDDVTEWPLPNKIRGCATARHILLTTLWGAVRKKIVGHI